MSKKFTEDRVVRLSKKKEQLLNEEQYADYLIKKDLESISVSKQNAFWFDKRNVGKLV